MANTYTQIHIHTVFAVGHRQGLIQQHFKDDLYRYLAGIIQNYSHKVLAINGMPDHVHLLFGMRPTQSLSDLIQDIKAGSSAWINKNGFVRGRFEWQQGYGAFSYHKNRINDVIDYIRDQEIHHAKTNFIEEYKRLLAEFDVNYEERFVFKEPY